MKTPTDSKIAELTKEVRELKKRLALLETGKNTKDRRQSGSSRRNAKNGQTLTSGRTNGYNHPKMSSTIQWKPPKGIGKKIAQKRRERGMSQQVLAARAGITRVALTRIEGGVKPMPATLRCIAAALDADVAELDEGLNGSAN